ncbi:head maturation protease, ClpP-related [Chryseobacterium sp.]|uniref:head maturation protease, ClpP-related n=1 Tax=Chryseobacterium sp. TaxID=1871047 RepID=UPI00289E8FDB|nr:head maturation protease, ClpP-related [Chryseobacterium sp.]
MSKKPFHYQLRNQASGNPEIRLYGYIGKYDEFDYKRFQQVFRDALENNNDLTIRMHCGGGSVYEGLAIYDLILGSQGHTKVIVEGMAASMGGVIALAADEIEMNENAFFMMHAVTAGCFGNKNDFKNGIQQIESCEERLGKIFGERTKADPETIKNWFDSGQDHWLDSGKCMELGICDSVIKPAKKRKNQQAENMTNKTPEEAFESFTLPEEPSEEQNNNNQHTDMKKETLLAALSAAGLAGALTVLSSDKDFENHLETLIGKAQRTDTLENELKEFKQSQAEVLISAALKAGKITAAEKDEWKNDAIKNYTLVAKSLERMAGKPDPNGQLVRQNPIVDHDRHELLNGREKWSFSDWQEKDPKGLERLNEEAEEEFEKLFNAEFTT